MNKTILKALFVSAATAIVAPLFGQIPPPPPQNENDAANVINKGKKSFLSELDPATRIQIIKRFDEDGDGRLNKEEREKAMKAVEEKSADLAEMKSKHAREVIARYDSNGDGMLDEKEVSSFLDEQRKMMDKSRDHRMKRRGNFALPKEILSKYDTDGDGKLSEAERKEMGKDMKRQRDEMLKKYDADGDGKLNDAERSALIQDPQVQNMMKRMIGDRLIGGRDNGNPPPPPPEE